MSRTVLLLHQGHAPITLQNAFHDALELIEDWPDGAPEPLINVEEHLVPVSSFIARMLECTDQMPLRSRDIINAIAGAKRGALAIESGDSFASGARLMLAFCHQRLSGCAAAVQELVLMPAAMPGADAREIR